MVKRYVELYVKEFLYFGGMLSNIPGRYDGRPVKGTHR